ncbi:hypothetical protein ECANGB1_471 [Enterospora canceri]|uniref:Uncharacterized protein n=1 Tax=Enterospora canceri TaxID=1081671 RepID=A0A1Y1S809_9MICR|nr:hypothetical protein ECANGB1_471 [Enterospora canceri]
MHKIYKKKSETESSMELNAIDDVVEVDCVRPSLIPNELVDELNGIIRDIQNKQNGVGFRRNKEITISVVVNDKRKEKRSKERRRLKKRIRDYNQKILDEWNMQDELEYGNRNTFNRRMWMAVGLIIAMGSLMILGFMSMSR